MANLISECPIPLVFKKILKDKLNGELEIRGNKFEKKLFFAKGNLQYATSSLTNERLGEILFFLGKIDRARLLIFDKIKEDSDDKLGRILVKSKLVNQQDIYIALLYQMKTIASSTFSLTSGEWGFAIKNPKIPGNQKFPIKMQEVIMGGVKEIKDISFYKNLFLYKSPVTTIMPESIGQLFSTDEIRFYVTLTKYAHFSNEQIISELKIPEMLFWKRIISLYLLNVIDFIQFRVDKELNKKIEEINDLHDRLKSRKVDPYELLGLEGKASAKDIKHAYDSLLKKFDSSTIATASDPKVKEKADFVFEEMGKAYKILSEKERKNGFSTDKKMKEINKEVPPKEEKKVNFRGNNPIKEASKLYLRANSYYNKKRYQDAILLLEQAIMLDSSRSSFLMLLGVCKIRIPSLRRSAEKNFQKVAEMEPWNADPIFYLGELYRAENLMKRAEKCFRRALEINIDHTLAGRMIKKLKKKTKKKPQFSKSKKR